MTISNLMSKKRNKQLCRNVRSFSGNLSIATFVVRQYLRHKNAQVRHLRSIGEMYHKNFKA